MRPVDLLALARNDGVDIRLAPSGQRLQISGAPDDVARWLAVLAPAHYQHQLIAELQGQSTAAGEIGPLSSDRHAAHASGSPDINEVPGGPNSARQGA